MLDTHYLVETPEAVDLSAQLAGPVSRVLAYTIDISIRFTLLTLLVIVLAFAGKAGWGVFLIASFVFEWIYPVVFEVLRKGQTPGKKMMKITVVNDDLTPIDWGSSLVRNLLRAADFLPFSYAFGLLSMSFSHKFQRLGDLAAGTIVIHAQVTQAPILSLPNVDAVVPPIALSVADEIAMMNYVQRSQELSPDRQQELANLLEAITHQRDQQAVVTVQGIGNWLLGGSK